MTPADKAELVRLARRVPRQGSAYAKTDPKGEASLEAFVERQLEQARASGRDTGMAAGRLVEAQVQLQRERSRSTWQWINAWWNAEGDDE